MQRSSFVLLIASSLKTGVKIHLLDFFDQFNFR
jgi:hypothetical protein